MNRKKILFIIPWLPYPLVSGGHQAIFNGILSVKEDFDIYITFPAFNETIDPDDIDGFLKLVPNATILPFENSDNIFIQRLIDKAKRLLLFISRKRGKKQNANSLEYRICSSWVRTVLPPNKSWANHIERICSQYNFDIIQVEMPPMLSQVLCLPLKSSRIYIHHELGFVRRRLEVKGFDNVDSYIEACMHFADLNEINQLNLYDMVVTLSAIDSAKLKGNGVIIPLRESFATVETEAKYLFTQSDSFVLSFVGGDSHSPNYGAIMWFLNNCWTTLKEKRPDYKLIVIGKWKKKNVQEIREKYKDVEFLGFVDDLRKSLSGSIMIVPIQVGSGIRMKILEACSMAVPFVSTTIGAEGIPVRSGEHCFLADEPDDFVSRIISLEDTSLQETFTRNAYNMVKEYYSLKSLRENRLQIYKELLSLR